uniref:BPTI/Kunitz inhibitor domain-containing protein n=1 Tax=Eptatretus burgeri TaxID=7764 RepID=A0A8C4WYB1_EPTBU
MGVPGVAGPRGADGTPGPLGPSGPQGPPGPEGIQGQKVTRCFLPLDAGPCENYVLQWYYQTTLSTCRPFVYGGCGGNNNRFESSEACQTFFGLIHKELDVCITY